MGSRNLVSVYGLCLASAARPGGEVTMSTKVPIYLKRGSHTGKEKLWNLLFSDRVSLRLGADRFML